MSDSQPARSTRSRRTTPRTGGVTTLQRSMLCVANAIFALTVPIVLGIGHALIPAIAALCALELLLSLGVFGRTAAMTGTLSDRIRHSAVAYDGSATKRFSVASALCTTPGQLVAARAVTGLGAAC